MASRSPTQAVNPSPPRTVEKMIRGISRLEAIISDVENFDPSTLTKRFSSEQKALEVSIDGALASVFGQGTAEYNRYQRATRLDHAGISMVSRGGPHDNRADARRNVAEGKIESVQLLRQAIRWLRDEIGDEEAVPQALTTPKSTSAQPLARKIFVVHGHDDGALQAVARFVQQLGFEPIILSEQANQGRTIIEKIEAEGDVGFAVVLLTPDDSGGKVGEAPRPRARQNVLLELGYFIGRLGRKHVCALATTSEMEIPTDFAGVVWQQLDKANGWKLALTRELDAVGFDVDWTKLKG